MKNAKEKAKELWDRYNFYWKEESDLIIKQKITHNIIAEIRRVLNDYDIEDSEYWDKVGLYIYHIEDVINNKKPCFEK